MEFCGWAQARPDYLAKQTIHDLTVLLAIQHWRYVLYVLLTTRGDVWS